MILAIFITFVCTSLLYAAILFLACRRVAGYLRGNASAIALVTQHVLVPLLGHSDPISPDEEGSKEMPE